MDKETVNLEYPKAKYHRTEGVRRVDTPEEDKALGPEWVDNPNFPPEAAEPPDFPPAAEVVIKRGPGRPPKPKEEAE